MILVAKGRWQCCFVKFGMFLMNGIWISFVPSQLNFDIDFIQYLLPPANEVWDKVIFLHLFVILFTGGGGVCLSACWDTTPRTLHHPPTMPPRTMNPPPPPGTMHPSRTMRTHPQDYAPPGTMHPPQDHAPPPQDHAPLQCRACWEIQSTRGRYASYWNAILLDVHL